MNYPEIFAVLDRLGYAASSAANTARADAPRRGLPGRGLTASFLIKNNDSPPSAAAACRRSFARGIFAAVEAFALRTGESTRRAAHACRAIGQRGNGADGGHRIAVVSLLRHDRGILDEIPGSRPRVGDRETVTRLEACQDHAQTVARHGTKARRQASPCCLNLPGTGEFPDLRGPLAPKGPLATVRIDVSCLFGMCGLFEGQGHVGTKKQSRGWRERTAIAAQSRDARSAHRSAERTSVVVDLPTLKSRASSSSTKRSTRCLRKSGPRSICSTAA